ncbi:SusC/RagA family TonB-linked outer membrane protein [Tunicatimonas pelagia]|uniref:SusC/RagA family TonB-linked outer membrane protein n=1 Tax=Tunicatimonas pelagia TaxID=931531 RepID=UPI002666D57C|nr:SusC/RagA family TonB-linked outer membrane protein [Tunicatimonas pelagia]WKN45091.1 SusC/RagA family TonB-linked outer membrane protein [Tunicatimonas pelagia]
MKEKVLLSFLLSCYLGQVFGQVQVRGKVTDALNDEPLPGVNIIVVGEQTGTITDVDGNYSIEVGEDAVLRFTSVGYLEHEQAVNEQSIIDVTMFDDIAQLGEVVVTAFGIEKERKSLGYAVQEVSGEDISTVKASPSAVSNLKGRVAGVNITETGGGPGSGVRVIIRGNNSLTQGNQPLYVVDGIPMDNSTTGEDGSLFSSRNTGSGISDINPDDIASMTVLKGPNAAALYGSRAANGVIMITTKTGQASKGIGVGISSSTMFSDPMILPEFQNEYGQGTENRPPLDIDELQGSGASWGGRLDGSDQLYWDGTTRPYVAQPNNVQDFFRTGGNFVNTLVLSGGNENITGRFSYTNTNNQAMVDNSFLQRHNFNLRTVAQLSDRLTLDAKATYVKQFVRNRIGQGSEGLLAGVYSLPRNAAIADFEDFRDEETGLARNVTPNSSNPYWTLNHDRSEDTRSRFMGFAKAQYQFTDWLSAHARIGTDFTDIRDEGVTQTGHWFFQQGRLNFTNDQFQETNADVLVMVSKDLSSDFHLDLNVGANHLYTTSQRMRVFGENLRIPAVTTIESADLVDAQAGVPVPRVTNSVYASASLNYRGIVFLDLTGRNDWTSTLPSTDWSYFYPSVNTALMVSELIDPSQQLFDALKLRGSWAQVGKDAQPWRLQNSYNLKAKNNSYLGITTLTVPNRWFDVNLQPEFTKTYEVGIEGSMFGDRFYFDASYYDIASTELIDIISTDNQQVNPFGYAEVHTNIGEITNRGIELMVGGTPLRTESMMWSTSVNFSSNRNRLTEFVQDVEARQWNITNGGGLETRATVGGSYGEIWGKTLLRDSVSGRPLLTADGRLQATPERTKLGDFQPDFLLGFSNTFRYRDFTLSMLIDGRFGGEVYAATQAAMDGSGNSVRSLQYRDEGIIVDGVIRQDDGTLIDNDQTILAQQYWGGYSGIAENYVIDQTNVRLRELSITYRFPQSLLDGNFLKSASVSLIGRNLFFLYKGFEGGFDPEMTLGTSNAGQGILLYGMPTPRSYGFSVNVNF